MRITTVLLMACLLLGVGPTRPQGGCPAGGRTGPTTWAFGVTFGKSL